MERCPSRDPLAGAAGWGKFIGIQPKRVIRLTRGALIVVDEYLTSLDPLGDRYLCDNMELTQCV